MLSSESLVDICNYPLVGALHQAISQANQMHASFVDKAVAQLSKDELDRFEQYLKFCEREGHSIDFVCACYLAVVEDTLGEQMYFMRHKKYRRSTYAEVADFVYHNREYMDKYMYGLVVTAFLWPNHIEMARFFNKSLPREKAGSYLEIGPGHGYYMTTAVTQSAFDSFVGVDISEASIAQTRAMVDFFAPQSSPRIDLQHCDFLDAGSLKAGSFDAIVMGEVLEHVEKPDVFLRRIHELARPGAFVYVTTCVNAPAVDHIYLWRSTMDLEAMIADCGFSIKEALRLPYEGRTLEQAEKQALSTNVAYVLERA